MTSLRRRRAGRVKAACGASAPARARAAGHTALRRLNTGLSTLMGSTVSPTCNRLDTTTQLLTPALRADPLPSRERVRPGLQALNKQLSVLIDDGLPRASVSRESDRGDLLAAHLVAPDCDALGP